METLKPLDELLLEHPFFAGMEEGPRKFIAGCGRNEVFHAGDYLFREGDAADRFFLIRHGTVALELHVPGREPLVVDTLQSGEIAGWSWCLRTSGPTTPVRRPWYAPSASTPPACAASARTTTRSATRCSSASSR